MNQDISQDEDQPEESEECSQVLKVRAIIPSIFRVLSCVILKHPHPNPLLKGRGKISILVLPLLVALLFYFPLP